MVNHYQLVNNKMSMNFGPIIWSIRKNLKGTNNSKCIHQAFGGTIINQMISQEDCGHRSEREEVFHTVSLIVKNKTSLKESLELYVKGDVLDGGNKWHCGKCEINELH